MKALAGHVGFGVVIALMLLSPFLLAIAVLFVIGLAVAVGIDLVNAIRGSGGRGGGRRYWSPPR